VPRRATRPEIYNLDAMLVRSQEHHIFGFQVAMNDINIRRAESVEIVEDVSRDLLHQMEREALEIRQLQKIVERQG
jgi:hypothetical protein